MRTKADIERKWARKLVEIKKKLDFRYSVLLQNRKRVYDRNFDYEIEKNERKKQAAIKKKEAEYHRKMLNEIRELENKPKRVYVTDWPKIKPLQFAMKIAQENARLRDTDENGRGRCISCNQLCDWEWLAGGHRYSRKFTTICLEPENINAQCHTCNRITWPLWNPALKLKTNEEYDKNIVKKFGEWAIEKLKKGIFKFTQTIKWTPWRDYDLKEKIPELIDENERLWTTKSPNFLSNHKPYKNWRKIWVEYDKRH